MSDAGARMQYVNPPIQEALVEFVFQSNQEWDWTVPGKLLQHPSIAPVYLGKARSQPRVPPQIVVNGSSMQLAAASSTVGPIQFVDEQGTRIIALTGAAISIHSLRPYEGWTNFRPRIEAALKAYGEVTSAAEVIRVGVRYLNMIEIKGRSVELEKYFVNAPASAPGLPPKIASILNRMEFIYDDECKAVVTFTTTPAIDEGSSAFMLDLDLIWDDGNAKSISQALEVMDSLHDREKQVFEALITNAARELFNVL